MRQIGIRELKEQIGDVLRRVRENGESFEITYHGKSVARVVPIQEPAENEPIASFWHDWTELGTAVSERWSEDVSALDALREDRSRLE